HAAPRDLLLAAPEEVVAEIEVGVLDDELRRGFHVAVGERIAFIDQILQLLEDLLRTQLRLRVSLDRDLAALRPDLDVEQRFDVFQVRVARAVDRLDARFRKRDLLHQAVFILTPSASPAREPGCGARAIASNRPATAPTTSDRRRSRSSGTRSPRGWSSRWRGS